MSNVYSDLFEAIREKCRQQRWYRSDMDNPEYIQRLSRQSSVYGHMSVYGWQDDEGNTHHITAETDLSQLPIPQRFTYPPATEEQLRRTEERLGFVLHPCLRGLYTQVANGGFGPGYGIDGIEKGYEGGIGTMVERHLWSRAYGGLVGPEIYAAQTGEDGSLKFSDNVQPDQWLEFCHWGCVIYSCLDNRTGAVYRYVDSGIDGMTIYRCEAPSLEAWFKCWIDGTLLFE